MVVSLTGGVGARPFHRVGARRNDDHGTNALEIAIRRYIEASNADPKPFVWTKTADDILDSVKLSCQRTSNSHHCCLVAERCWDQVRCAIEEYTWRFDGLRRRAPCRRRT
jgi:hypothetical protein